MAGATLELTTYDAEAELPHSAGPDEWWQESVVLMWNDADAGIGGLIRIGHEPNYDGGITPLWFGVFTSDGIRYRRNVTSPLTEEDRLENGFGSYEGRYRFTWEDGVRLQVDDEDLSIDIQERDFFPGTGFFPKDAGSLTEEFAAAHIESSGAVTGTITLDGTTYDVDGLAHRDHSWGTRKWDTVLSHRWFPATFGPDLSFGAITWHTHDGTLARYGYVARDGRVEPIDDFDVFVEMEPDALTYRGGTGTWTVGDEQFVVRANPIDALLSEHHDVVCIDAISEVEHDGRKGFGILEASTNPRAGNGPVLASLRANTTNGLSRR
jgi:hypothetical protein